MHESSTWSVHRERIMEHVFVGQMLRSRRRRGVMDAEVLRSDFDDFGYDLVFARGSLVRHVQFKQGDVVSRTTGRPRKPVRVHGNRVLADKPSGCLIWMGIDEALQMGPFYGFGEEPGRPLPALDGARQPQKLRRTSDGARAPRTLDRLGPYRSSVRLESLDEVTQRLLRDV